MSRWVECVELYQKEFDKKIQNHNDAWILCCASIQNIIEGVHQESNYREQFKKLALEFYGHEKYVRAFNDWHESDFIRLFAAFTVIFGVKNPWKCHPPEAVRHPIFFASQGHEDCRIDYWDIPRGPVLVVISGP